MASFVVTIPDALVPDLLDALTRGQRREDGSYPAPKAQLAREKLARWLRGEYVAYMASQAHASVEAEVIKARDDASGIGVT